MGNLISRLPSKSSNNYRYRLAKTNGTCRTISTMNSTLRPLVVCGPSGSGKSTLLKKLIDEFGDYLGFSVSRK